MSLTRSHLASPHFQRVQAAMYGFGQPTPDRPTCDSPLLWTQRFTMLMEEVMELADALGLRLQVGSYDDVKFESMRVSAIPGFVLTMAALPSVLDAIADISVVNTGNFVACGVPDIPILECVDANNLTKIAGGKMNPETGKFEKAADHQPPRLDHVLAYLQAG